MFQLGIFGEGNRFPVDLSDEKYSVSMYWIIYTPMDPSLKIAIASAKVGHFLVSRGISQLKNNYSIYLIHSELILIVFFQTFLIKIEIQIYPISKAGDQKMKNR